MKAELFIIVKKGGDDSNVYQLESTLWVAWRAWVCIGNGDKDRIRVRMRIKLRGGKNVYVSARCRQTEKPPKSQLYTGNRGGEKGTGTTIICPGLLQYSLACFSAGLVATAQKLPSWLDLLLWRCLSAPWHDSGVTSIEGGREGQLPSFQPYPLLPMNYQPPSDFHSYLFLLLRNILQNLFHIPLLSLFG